MEYNITSLAGAQICIASVDSKRTVSVSNLVSIFRCFTFEPRSGVLQLKGGQGLAALSPRYRMPERLDRSQHTRLWKGGLFTLATALKRPREGVMRQSYAPLSLGASANLTVQIEPSEGTYPIRVPYGTVRSQISEIGALGDYTEAIV